MLVDIQEIDDLSAAETEMAAVIDLLSSDDDCDTAHSVPSNRSRRELGCVQDGAVEPNSERDCESPGPALDGSEHRDGGEDSSGPGSKQVHVSAAEIQTKGKMSSDNRRREQFQSDSLSRQFWQAGELYEKQHVHASKRRRAVQGLHSRCLCSLF